jgi:hypothetical protein
MPGRAGDPDRSWHGPYLLGYSTRMSSSRTIIWQARRHWVGGMSSTYIWSICGLADVAEFEQGGDFAHVERATHRGALALSTRRNLDQTGAAVAFLAAEVDRDVMFPWPAQDGLGVAAGDGVDRLVLVHRAGEGDVGPFLVLLGLSFSVGVGCCFNLVRFCAGQSGGRTTTMHAAEDLRLAGQPVAARGARLSLSTWSSRMLDGRRGFRRRKRSWSGRCSTRLRGSRR